MHVYVAPGSNSEVLLYVVVEVPKFSNESSLSLCNPVIINLNDGQMHSTNSVQFLLNFEDFRLCSVKRRLTFNGIKLHRQYVNSGFVEVKEHMH